MAGNHDAERDDEIAKLREELKVDPTKGLCFEIKKRKFNQLMCRFVEFEQFYKKMHPNNTDIKSYGVDIVNIDDMKIAVVRLNSSIYTFDKYDYMQLGLSKIQLDELTNQYKNKKKEHNKFDLTIALMHHPDDWLRMDESKQMWRYFTSEEFLPIDIILHGHTHEGKIGGKLDLDNLVLSLVTGTTYEDGKKEKMVLQIQNVDSLFITSMLMKNMYQEIYM